MQPLALTPRQGRRGRCFARHQLHEDSLCSQRSAFELRALVLNFWDGIIPFMQETRFFHPMEVRYGDLDPQGHLNNAKYLTYFEQARVLYFEALGLFSKGQSFMDIGVIVADIHIKYLAPVYLGAPIKVGVRTANIGNKSITVQETIVDGDSGKIYADGAVVLVAYDYHARKTTPVLDEWRRKIIEFEGIK